MSVGWETAEREDGLLVQLTGELDISSASGVESRLIEVEQRAPERLFLDLRRVNFIDSTGLSMIINADGRAKKAGRRLTIVSGDGVPRRILRTVGLEDRLEVLSDLPAGGWGDDHLPPARRREPDRAARDQLRPVAGGLEPQLARHGPQDRAHLEHREARADAAPHAAAERQPRVGLRRALEEALGAERVRIAVDVLAPVHEVDARRHHRADGDLVLAELERLVHDAPRDDGDRRPQPQRLLHHGVRVLARAAVIAGELLEPAWQANHPLERP